MRQIVLDTETTGLETEQNHRIIEIGCVEILNRRATGRHFHRYLNPERDIDAGASNVHGMTRERLANEPTFSQVYVELLDFIRGAELIIHNADFDIGFLEYELKRVAWKQSIREICGVLDSLALARRMHPGQRNGLDALCKRYSVDNSHRDFHGAMKDARILADLYLVMTGGQVMLTLSEDADEGRNAGGALVPQRPIARGSFMLVPADADELAAHEHVLTLLDKASNGRTVWRTL